MTASSMKLMNCTRCDDVVKLVETPRQCECGMSSGYVYPDDSGVSIFGPARVLTIAWEVYDGLGEGSQGRIGVLPRAQYRAKGP